MTNFKTKFNYIIFGLRVIFFLFFTILFFVLLYKVIPRLSSYTTADFKIALGLFAAFFVFTFLPYRFGKLLIKERNDIVLSGNSLVLKDAVTSKKKSYDISLIKGFSTTVYQTRIWSFKEIIFYFNNGDKVHFPQFLYWNFKDIKQSLIDNGVNYLGHEPYRWKWFDTRHYLFD